MNNKIFTFFIILPLFLFGFINVGLGQISLTTVGAAYTQNFDTLANSGSSNTWTDNSTIAGWYTNRTVYIGDNGAGITGGLISYGSASNTERSLGALTSGSVTTIYIGVRLTNNTGTSLSSFDISYKGEQWRQTANAQKLVFEYQIGATSLTTGTWTAITALDFTAPKTGTAGALDGNVYGNYSNLSSTINAAVANGQEIWFRWTKTGTTSPGLGVDDFSVTPKSAIISAPTTQASNITFSSVLTNQMTATWTNGDGAKRIVKMNTVNSFTNPADGTDPTANTVYGGSGEQVVYNNNSNSVTITGLSQNTTYWYRVYEYNGTGTGTKYLTSTASNNPNSQTTSSASLPTKLLITSINSGSIVQVNPSTFSITIQAQDNNGIAQNVVSQTAINLSISTGTGNLNGAISGTIFAGSNSVTISSITYSIPETGVSIKASVSSGDVLADGVSSPFTVYSQTPSNQPTNLTFSNINLAGFTASFTAANGSPTGYLVLKKSGSVYPTGTPAIGTIYNIGDAVGDANVAYVGSSVTFIESALTSGTQYSYSIFSYNGTGSTINYLTTTPLQSQQYTMFSEPTNPATNVTFSNISGTGFTVGWTKGNGTNSLVLVKAGSPVDEMPSDGSFYNSNTTFGSGAEIGTGNFVVYNYTSNSVQVKGLTEGTNYYVAVFEFNGGSYTGVQNYLLNNPATGSQIPSAPKYYSKSTGDPEILTNWKTKRDGTGDSPSDFITPATFIIQNGHTMTNTSAWSFGGSGSVLEIENGGILQADYAITIATGATFKIDSAGTYIQNSGLAMGSTIFQGTEVFSKNSNIEIRVNPSGTTTPSSPGYGNLTINVTTGASAYGWAANITDVQGNLTILGTGTSSTRHAFTSTVSTVIHIGGNFLISGGNFWLSSGSGTCTVNLDGDLIINGGLLDLANSSGVGTMNIGGNLNISSGTLLSKTAISTINFNGNSKAFIQSGGTLTNSNINWTVNSGASLSLSNNLPVASSRSMTVNGILDCGNNVVSGTGTFSLSSGATLKTANSTGINEAITVSGTKTFDPAANYEFNGTAAQVTGASLTTANNITINNPAGVTLSGAATLNGQLNLSSGNLITTETKLLTLGTGASLTGGSVTSFVDGPMVWNVNDTKDYVFPVGKGSRYLPMVIKPSTTDASTFKVTYNNTPYTNTTTFGTGIAVVSLLDYYELSKISGNAAVQLTMSWDAMSGITTSNEQYLRVAHWNGSLWEDLGDCTISGDQTAGTITTNNPVSSFSPFVLASSHSDNPMPVSLKSLTSNVAGRNINLKWVTGSEINNSGFEVERKGFSGEFVKVGFVQGKGTVTTATNYEFTDRNLMTGKYSYRLKQIDNNGNFEYFNLNSDAVVGVPSKFDLSQNYPNPFNPATKINFDLPKDSKLSLKLYDMLGREVSTLVNEFRTAGYYTVDFNASSLSSGIYFYRLLAGEFSSVKKMVVVK